MVNDTVHCLFEQSGTFKNAFKKYGIEYKWITLPYKLLVFEAKCN